MDANQKSEGTKILRLAFDGDSEASALLLSQTVLIKPQLRYRLYFSVKAKEIVSGGLPIIVVRRADKDEVLASSEPLPQSTETWQKMSVEFTAPEGCEAIVLNLTRNACANPKCPIFGVLWFDSFSLEELPS